MEKQIAPHIESTRWNCPVPEKRWKGFRERYSGIEAFRSWRCFEEAQMDELRSSLSQQERLSLGRLLERAQKPELEVFTRTRGCNPLFDPETDLNMVVGIAKAEPVFLDQPASAEANQAILMGDVVHVLFQAGEASRFNQGPFYNLSPVQFAIQSSNPKWKPLLTQISKAAENLDSRVSEFLTYEKLGPKQPLFIRAALRRIVQSEINAKRLSVKKAMAVYEHALREQKLLFFVSQQGQVSQMHDDVLRKRFSFFGFNPENIVTIEQDLIHGLTVSAEGEVSLLSESWAQDAAGHLYALLQSVRPGDFVTYSETGRPLRADDFEALGYLAGRGGKFLNVIRINDMDRHTTEIVNTKALSYAMGQFRNGIVNVIECVSNPTGQKGGTGLTFGDLPYHFLTETHENSFPVLSRAFESALNIYRQAHQGRNPAYNAMRQWADLQATRTALRQAGGRLVFIPRQKELAGQTMTYLGVDMPMGDLSLLAHVYPSKMFQFIDEQQRELCIHDVKLQDHLDAALRTILHQVQEKHIIDAANEHHLGNKVDFSAFYNDPSPYAAPSAEFN